MFTRVSKVFLYILSVAFALVSIVMSILIANEIGEYVVLAFIISLVIFLFISFLILMTFGLYVEMANNILDIKKILERGNGSYVASPAPVQQVQPIPQPINNAPQNFAGVPNAPQDNGVADNLSIKCPNCGEINESGSMFCVYCGAKIL